ncbi:hypothetical protein BT93_D0678 [Corymbia citriodora subsp. variegata]|nr:hypothetical protein BT93_D0678 [Corymbia citriodora subsp. variegata]
MVIKGRAHLVISRLAHFFYISWPIVEPRRREAWPLLVSSLLSLPHTRANTHARWTKSQRRRRSQDPATSSDGDASNDDIDNKGIFHLLRKERRGAQRKGHEQAGFCSFCRAKECMSERDHSVILREREREEETRGKKGEQGGFLLQLGLLLREGGIFWTERKPRESGEEKKGRERKTEDFLVFWRDFWIEIGFSGFCKGGFRSAVFIFWFSLASVSFSSEREREEVFGSFPGFSKERSRSFSSSPFWSSGGGSKGWSTVAGVRSSTSFHHCISSKPGC